MKKACKYIILVMLWAMQVNSYAQCPGGASWAVPPVNGSLTATGVVQVLDTVKVKSFNAASFSAGRPGYSTNTTTWAGYPYENLYMYRGGGGGATTSFKFQIPLDSNTIHFRISDVRGDGFNAETQRILGYNNGVPVSATANESINGAVYNPLNGNITGASTTTSTTQSSIRIFFNSPVDSVVIRAISFNDFVVLELAARCDVILPVNKIDLTGKNTTNGIQLKWNITGDADKIEIERSGNDNIWILLSNVDGNVREFLDSNPFPESNYYRLKITDPQGNIKYSAVKLIKLNRTNNLQTRIYPNPFKNFITCESDVKIISFKIYSASGAIVISKKITGTNSFTEILPTSLSKGIYELKILYKNGQERTYKLIKDF